jgi:hypothetical protein
MSSVIYQSVVWVYISYYVYDIHICSVGRYSVRSISFCVLFKYCVSRVRFAYIMGFSNDNFVTYRYISYVPYCQDDKTSVYCVHVEQDDK